MSRLGVLADDWTGAGDAALALAERGHRVDVGGPDANGRWTRPATAGDVWVISTESRARSPRAAAGRVRAALAALRRWGAERVFKKIDSTLRGPVAAELSAFVDFLGLSRAAVVPAFPAAGRTTRGGRHFVDGRPLHRTAFARDPRHPRATSALRDVLGAAASRAWCPDVKNNRDLTRVAAIVRRGREVSARAAVGSSAFLAAWAGRVKRRSSSAWEAMGAGDSPTDSPILVVAGSAHPRTRRQLARLRAARLAVSVIAAPRRRENPQKILNNMVRSAVDAVRRDDVRRLVLTGGETAWAVCARLGWRRWRIVGRLERGIPLLQDPVGRVRMVMKPGGFGCDDVLVRAVRRLTRETLTRGTRRR